MSITESSPPRRLRRSSEASRENNLAAAEAILKAEGPQNLKLVEVAKAAGVVNATVLHHFGSIGDLQKALMTRMIEQLVERIVSIAKEAQDAGQMAGQSTAALFDAFEERGVARLAAWLELTGESRRLTLVREAVQQVMSARPQDESPTAAALEDFILICISVALGVGLFGATLSALLGKPETQAREMALQLIGLQIRTALSTPAQS